MYESWGYLSYMIHSKKLTKYPVKSFIEMLISPEANVSSFTPLEI